jgi:hypothetical protein
MNRTLLISFTMLAAVSQLSAQGYQRRATMTGGGGDRGKCTIEVVVDGAAEVEIRGDSATLRNLAGNQPQWRRFECNGSIPPNPVDFRFAGVDGRGRQTLVRDPRNGGAAVVRIEDSDGGQEGYTFDLFWGGGYGDNRGGDYRGQGSGNYRVPPPAGPGGWDRGPSDAGNYGVASCERAVRDRLRRDSYREIDFGRIAVDNNPGRSDWVIGNVSAVRRGRAEYLNFSCGVNLRTGEVRSLDLRRR